MDKLFFVKILFFNNLMKNIRQHIIELKEIGFSEFTRKLNVIYDRLIVYLFKPTEYIVGSFLYIILNLFSIIINIRIGEIESRIIGHFSLPIEIYLSEKDLGVHKTKRFNLDIFFYNRKVANKFLLKKWIPYFNIGPRFLLSPLYHFMLNSFPKSKHLVPYRHWKFDFVNWQQCDKYLALEKTKPHLIFNSNENSQIEKILDEFGIKNQDKIICFHIRDPFYHGGKNAKFGPRDSNITLFEPAMYFLAENGFKVVRVGRTVSSTLNIKHQNIFDYANSSIKSDMLDIYFMSRTLFTIGTISGLENVSTMFRKPLFAINCVEWRGLDHYTYKQCPIFLPKQFLWKSNSVPLTLNEIIQTGAYEFALEEQFEKSGIVYKDNTQDDILITIKQCLNVYLNQYLYLSEDIFLQNEFLKLIPLRNGRNLASNIATNFLQKNQNYFN